MFLHKWFIVLLNYLEIETIVSRARNTLTIKLKKILKLILKAYNYLIEFINFTHQIEKLFFD